MGKNNNKKSSRKSAPAASRSAGVVKSTPVRNSAVPKMTSRRETAPTVSPKSSRKITADMIAERAYFISVSGNGGSQDENWHRAERELRAGI